MNAALWTSRPAPILVARDVCKSYGGEVGCDGLSLTLHPGEIISIVGESGSGKTTFLRCISGALAPDQGDIQYDVFGRGLVNVERLTEEERYLLRRSEWGIVHQNPKDGLRMQASAGGNIGEPLMMAGSRHYGEIRARALDWLSKVEINPLRIDDKPDTFSGGMQQRLQIARSLASGPRLLLMDEPTGGLDVSVQAHLLDLLRRLVRELSVSAIIVTHDLAVARLLADRILVMQKGRVIEEGLSDRVLDDPHHPYTQLLVSSVLQI